MSFFVRAGGRRGGGSHNVRRGKSGAKNRRKFATLPPPVKKSKKDVEISSDEEDSEDDDVASSKLDADQGVSEGQQSAASGSDSDAEETAEQKKLRLATAYLDQIRQKQDDDNADEEHKHSLIAHRLKRDLLEQSGRLYKPLARSVQVIEQDAIIYLKNQHRLPITRTVLSPDEKVIFSASKDGTLVRWSITSETGQGHRTTRVKNAHSAAVLALALSSDGRYLASGCAKNVLTIWNPDTLEKLHTFGIAQHRGKVTGSFAQKFGGWSLFVGVGSLADSVTRRESLAFRYGSHQLFSCSADRSVKVWSLDEMAYVETLVGHEDSVTCIDSFIKDRALTSGGRDGTLRLWKIPEESHLVFQGNQSSIDCCAMLNDETFVSGHDDGCVYLWKVMKKKPVASVAVAPAGQWVTAVGAVRSSDLIAAGSSCGYIVLLAAINIERGADGRCALEEVRRIPCVGFVNSLTFSASSRLLVVAVSQEHAMGRWERIKEAKNAVQIMPLTYSTGER
ncbi:U3 small nucleolar RNA-interacting protein 2-like [Tropilaelaps mercedesae]|uniref:U3 small nucleolar RNA-interacting protein 2-like n=1 Tax=Tropilaelaps mercedesae TaxID=418985 RepID=A0A1V9Y270_9ACAR|nr:U3 small nucleolar RNA-interacting protein 2-like [Tropilaelaps mercedesae]